MGKLTYGNQTFQSHDSDLNRRILLEKGKNTTLLRTKNKIKHYCAIMSVFYHELGHVVQCECFNPVVFVLIIKVAQQLK